MNQPVNMETLTTSRTGIRRILLVLVFTTAGFLNAQSTAAITTSARSTPGARADSSSAANVGRPESTAALDQTARFPRHPLSTADSGDCDRRCAVLHGAAFGLVTGAIGGALYGAHEDRTDNHGASAVGIDAAAFGALGLLVGALAGSAWPITASEHRVPVSASGTGAYQTVWSLRFRTQLR